MNVPGSNLLGIALGAIRPQRVAYMAWTGKATNAVGKDVPTYAPRRDVWGSFQPVSRDKFEALGLDLSKSYATFYATGAYRPVMRDGQPDRFAFGGRLYEVQGLVDWFAQDGWQAVLMVDIGADA